MIDFINPCNMCADYESGMTMKQIADNSGVCAGTVFNVLKKTNCKIRKRGFPKGVKQPAEWGEKSGRSRRGKPKSEETRRRLSEAKKCHYNGLNGSGHRKVHVSGYILTYVPDHPYSSADGYVFEHTVVMEQKIGRYLEPNEVVHHINRIKSDNRLENLVLMDRHEHMSMHMKERNAKRRAALSIG